LAPGQKQLLPELMAKPVTPVEANRKGIIVVFFNHYTIHHK
jgi:hypothetical protein